MNAEVCMVEVNSRLFAILEFASDTTASLQRMLARTGSVAAALASMSGRLGPVALRELITALKRGHHPEGKKVPNLPYLNRILPFGLGHVNDAIISTDHDITILNIDLQLHRSAC